MVVNLNPFMILQRKTTLKKHVLGSKGYLKFTKKPAAGEDNFGVLGLSRKKPPLVRVDLTTRGGGGVLSRNCTDPSKVQPA